MKRFAFPFVAAILLLVPTISFAFYVDNDGSVGINNTSPQSALDVSGSLYSRLVTPTASSTPAIDWGAANVQSLTLTSDATPSFTNGDAGGLYTLEVHQDATGGHVISWPSDVEWAGGAAPDLTSAASSTDLVNFVYDGDNYLGYAFTNFEHPGTGIGFDNATSSKSTSLSLAVGSASNRLLVAWVPESMSGEITGVSYNGTAMTKYDEWDTFYSGWETLWYLYAPDIGTHTVSITDSESIYDQVVVASYSGVKQSGFPDKVSSPVSGLGTSCSASVTPVAPGAWGLMPANINRNFSSGTNFTKRGASNGNPVYGDTNGTISGSTGMTVTQSSSNSYWCVMLSIAPA
jgi:hypothetical protein